MEFGLLPNWSWPRDGNPRKQMAHTIAQTRTAIDAGYDALWFGQHYISEGNNQFQPLPLLSRTAAFAGEATIGTSVFLLPLHNPIAVAENIATIDTLFDGDLVFGVALGYKPAEFDAFGIDIDDRVGRFVEALRLLRKLWTEDNVTFSGDYFAVTDVTIDPKPNDGDGIPIVLGGNAERAVERAGALGDGWIISARTSLDDARELASIYRDAAAESGSGTDRVLINREVYVAETTDEAVDTVLPLMKERTQRWLDRGARDTTEQITDIDEQAHELLTERFVGSPEDCIDRIASFRDATGIDAVIAMYNWRGLSHGQMRDSIELFADDVIPYFAD